MASMAASINILIAQFGGADTTNHELELRPRLPAKIKEISYNVQYQSQWIAVNVSHRKVSVSIDSDYNQPITVKINGTSHKVLPGIPTEVTVNV